MQDYGETKMKRRMLTVSVILVVMLLCSCGREEKRVKPTPAPEITAEVSETPEPQSETVEYYAGSFDYIYPSEKSHVWYCNGTMSFDTTEKGKSEGDVWSIKGRMTKYVVTNSRGEELFQLVSEINDSKIRYILKKEENSKVLCQIPDENSLFEVYSAKNRTVFRQNGVTFMVISAEADYFTVSSWIDDKGEAMVFPVQNFVAEQSTEKMIVDFSYIFQDKKSFADLYDGNYLNALAETAKNATYEEWPMAYVQYTGMDRRAGGMRKNYQAVYQANTVLVDGRSGSISYEYSFNELSEGMTNVEYYTYDTVPETLRYTFSIEELDTFRTDIFEMDNVKETEKAEVRKTLIPFMIEWNDECLIERGICDTEGQERCYVRFLYYGEILTGEVIAVYDYESRDTLFLMIDGLGHDEKHIYADGFIKKGTDGSVRELITRKFDNYGVMISEQTESYSADYTYEFNDFSYGGEDDTIRHEWMDLISYLEDAPKKGAEDSIPSEDNPDDGNTSDDGDNPEEG